MERTEEVFVQRMKEFGVYKKTQEGLMADFLEKTVNEIRKTDGENFDALTYFMDISTKIIYSVFLSGYKVDDDDVRKFNEAYSATLVPLVGTTGLLTGPLVKLMMYIRPEFKRFRRNKFLMFSVLDKIIEEHEKSFKKDNIRNVVDHYINTRKLLKEKCDPKSKLYTGKALQRSLLQFIGDGGHFVGFTISLVLKALHDRPDTQKEIQREIDGTVGRSRFPSYDDRSRMPYTNAVIQECFRSTDVLPVVSSLECTKETTVGGCHVPKGAITLVGVWDSSHDPNVYEKPEEFDPTRFLPNEEQKPKCTPPLFFGIGKRSCIGEPFVFMETFLFVCTILQNFDLHPEKESGTDESPSKKQEASGLSVVFRATPRKS